MFRNKKNLAIIAIAVLVVAAAGAYAVHYRTVHSSKPAVTHLPNVDYTPATSQDNTATEDRKSQPPATTSPTSSASSSAHSTAPTATITRAGISGNNLQVATLVEGASSGTCTLTVSQSGQQSITASENVQLQNSVQTCPVFVIPLNKFPNRNAWNVSVTVSSSGVSSTTDWQANPVQLTN